MVARVMRWRPWTPLRSEKYEVRVVVRRIEGVPVAGAATGVRAAAEVRWKGPKTALSSLRRGRVRRDWTREEEVRQGGVVEWDEEFLTAATLTSPKEKGAFLPWEIAFSVFTCSMIGTASLNLAEFASAAVEKEMEINVTLLPLGVTTDHFSHHECLKLSEMPLQKHYDNSMANWSPAPDFGDDSFTVGSWELKEVVSRDDSFKLCTQAFLASIDQRSEQASGESACAVLVAVIADWFQANPHMMPIKSQFDHLIREGSLDWRTLCKNQTYRERFPDKHFDLETVLEAKDRPLSIVPANSFVGFFYPEGPEDSDSFKFLDGAMSFDNIWDEIKRAGSGGFPHIYIVSWNDHFFILKVERDAYYIIDTLGERLHEGCNQAYILKFDNTTTIYRHKKENKPGSGMARDAETQIQQNHGVKEELSGKLLVENPNLEDELICRGKESCKEYIKTFLAAIPIRELQIDLRKGLTTSTLIHNRLQIEFHYTDKLKDISAELQPASESTVKFLYSAESDSEFSCPTESDLEPSWTREGTPDISWPVESAAEFSWPVEPAAAFFLTPSVNLEVEVV
ncbi:hypothetical protein B296_00016392 [Ensete ventricosum]|uniref:C2 NT-type domain-containing protein n=1 Tax=Ensete ventricosum TaxID=4639 RepID=A0A427B649_ENSVE|nr:hypothetical protein B296_00016392 [Ensete ventricosum]